MKAMDVKNAVLNVMSLSMVTSYKWIAFWGCFLNIFVKGMIFYEIGHLEWFFFFRGAPSGYFGESSAGTFNPSWYLNDLGTMYKRVGLLILTFCSVQICWNTPLYACRFNFQDPAHFSREPPTHAFHAFKVHIFRDPPLSLLTALRDALATDRPVSIGLDWWELLCRHLNTGMT